MEKYLKWVSSEKERMIAGLTAWANINSGTGNLKGLATMLATLKEAFQKLGPKIQEIELQPYACFDDKGTLIQQALGKALYLTKREEAPIQVFLGGHMDTVFPANSPFQTAERIDADILKGPGVTDMKGGLMILLKALEVLEMSPFAKNIGWHVVINSDEEIGSPGSAPLLSKVAKKCRLGMIFEPCMASGALVNARKGSLNFTVLAKGKSAHAGRDFHLGKNAISALSHFILQAEQMTDLVRGITVNVGKITGGGALNIVPDLAVCGINVRVEHPQDLAKVKEQFQTIADRLNAEKGFSLLLHINSERPPKPFEEKHQALFHAFAGCAADLGRELMFQSSGGVTDGNLLFAAGLPTIDSLGALGGEIHTFDEFILLDSLVTKTELAALFLLKLAKGDFE